MTLRETISRGLDGSTGTALSWGEVSRYLNAEYWDNTEQKKRKARAATRQRFYDGRGDDEMYDMLGQVFRDPEVIKLRSEWIRHAKFNNVLRRAIHELATVYSQPALRTISDPAADARYQEMQRVTRMHEVMQRVNRLGYLHRAVFVYPRVRLDASGTPAPALEVVTPDRFDAIAHPLDATLMIAISIDLDLRSASMLSNLPARLLITARETAYVSAQGAIIESTVTPHAFGRIPGVLFTLDPPTGCIFDSHATDDLEAAHRAVWFENILLLKESKSATKTTIVSGDVSTAARNQVDDVERPVQLPEGVSASTLDRAMDLSMFRETSKSIYEQAAANHGIPPVTLDHGGVQSADARDLVRTPLKELRLAQHVPLRDVERELASVQAAVYAPLPAYAFTLDGWNVDFCDPQTPLGQKEALDVFLVERKAGMNSTIAEVMRRNPDLTRDAAKALIAQFNDDELWRDEIMRPRMVIAGGMGGATGQGAAVDVVAPPHVEAAA